METRKRTWLIIGFDLLIVITVFMLYSLVIQPVLQAPDYPVSSSVRIEGLTYSLEAFPVKEETHMHLKFTISNSSTETLEVVLPAGITLLLSDGRDYIYDRSQVASAGRHKLTPDETISWEHRARYPALDAGKIYAGYHIDERRQKWLEVPLPN